MAGYIKACSVTEIPSGSMKQIILGGTPVAVLHVDGEYFALSDTCTHAKCSLAQEGLIEGGVITCGCHGAQFNAKTGGVLSLPATVDLVTYDVLVKGGNVLVKI